MTSLSFFRVLSAQGVPDFLYDGCPRVAALMCWLCSGVFFRPRWASAILRLDSSEWRLPKWDCRSRSRVSGAGRYPNTPSPPQVILYPCFSERCVWCWAISSISLAFSVSGSSDSKKYLLSESGPPVFSDGFMYQVRSFGACQTGMLFHAFLKIQSDSDVGFAVGGREPIDATHEGTSTL